MLPCSSHPVAINCISAEKSNCYDFGLAEAACISVNSSFVALSIQDDNCGEILITRLEEHDKTKIKKLCGHERTVLDLKFSFFSEFTLASASADCSVKIWRVLHDASGTVIRTLRIHTKPVEQIEWHSTVDSLLLTRGTDSKIVLWDIDADCSIMQITSFAASHISFSPDSSCIAATSVDSKSLKIFNARDGVPKYETFIFADTQLDLRVQYLTQRLLVVCSCTATQQKLICFSISSLIKPCATITVYDGSVKGQINSFYDPDLSILYITCKDDDIIRLFRVMDEEPYLKLLGQTSQKFLCSSHVMQERRVLQAEKGEMCCFYGIISHSCFVQMFSIYIPDYVSLFGPKSSTRTLALSSSVSQWLGAKQVTSSSVISSREYTAPVHILQTSHSSNQCTLLRNTKELRKTNSNNEKKFDFLSKATKPDYRSLGDEKKSLIVQEQCDKSNTIQASTSASSLEQVVTESKVENKISMNILSGSSRSVASAPAEIYRSEGKDLASPIASIFLPFFSNEQAPLAVLDDLGSPESPTGPEAEFSKLESPGSSSVCSNSSSITPSLLHEPSVETEPPLRTPSPTIPQPNVPSMISTPHVQLHTSESAKELEEPRKLDFRVPSYAKSEASISRPGTIKPHFGYATARESQTYLVPNFAQQAIQNEQKNMNDENENGNQEISRISNSTSSSSVLEASVTCLEKLLRKSDAKVSQLEKLAQIQQQDIESLRYEISWKDERINYLNKELDRLSAENEKLKRQDD